MSGGLPKATCERLTRGQVNELADVAYRAFCDWSDAHGPSDGWCAVICALADHPLLLAAGRAAGLEEGAGEGRWEATRAQLAAFRDACGPFAGQAGGGQGPLGDVRWMRDELQRLIAGDRGWSSYEDVVSENVSLRGRLLDLEATLRARAGKGEG